MASLAVRMSFRWVPDEATGPTDTLVTTSTGQRYVDVRFLKKVENDTDAETMKAVQWATAGQTVMMEREGRPFASFYTFVDSQTTQPGTSIDEGFLEPNEEGNLFEHGDALNPETNRITGYEELWKPIEVKAVSGAAATPRNVVIELHDDSKGQRGRVVCTGQYCQGVVRERDDFAVERWSWHDGAWSQRRIGSLWLPTQAAIHNRYLTVGQQVEEAGAVWKVVEADL